MRYTLGAAVITWAAYSFKNLMIPASLIYYSIYSLLKLSDSVSRTFACKYVYATEWSETGMFAKYFED